MTWFSDDRQRDRRTHVQRAPIDTGDYMRNGPTPRLCNANTPPPPASSGRRCQVHGRYCQCVGQINIVFHLLSVDNLENSVATHINICKLLPSCPPIAMHLPLLSVSDIRQYFLKYLSRNRTHLQLEMQVSLQWNKIDFQPGSSEINHVFPLRQVRLKYPSLNKIFILPSFSEDLVMGATNLKYASLEKRWNESM